MRAVNISGFVAVWLCARLRLQPSSSQFQRAVELLESDAEAVCDALGLSADGGGGGGGGATSGGRYWALWTLCSSSFGDWSLL